MESTRWHCHYREIRAKIAHLVKRHLSSSIIQWFRPLARTSTLWRVRIRCNSSLSRASNSRQLKGLAMQIVTPNASLLFRLILSVLLVTQTMPMSERFRSSRTRARLAFPGVRYGFMQQSRFSLDCITIETRVFRQFPSHWWFVVASFEPIACPRWKEA